MTRWLLCIALAALVGCGPPNPNGDPAGRSDTRQIPTNPEPGIHITGYANVGVKTRF